MTTLLDRHDLVLADLDGTLYQGREAIPGAVDAVRAAGGPGRADAVRHQQRLALAR